MKFSPKKLSDIAKLLNAEFAGSGDLLVTGLNEIHRVENGDIVFVDHPKYYEKALQSAATFVLINKKIEAPEGKGLIFSDDPFRDFNFLINFFQPFEFSEKQIHETATMGSNCKIHSTVSIGKNVVIGNNCIIHPNVVLYNNTILGNNVIIHSNTVIGADAFYYKNRDTFYDKLLTCGKVVIEDNVEIGACCTIDRGVSSDTRIGKGSKLDNHIQIGHDTVIGEKCLFASQVGIAGCVNIGNHVILWGQVGVTSGITIGDKAVVFAQSGIDKSLEGGKIYFGSPAQEAKKAMREMASIRNLPDLIQKLKDIERNTN
ncbi:MAG: UDP-3-O-(3-hydroxymyristoyl)glucosamine N-acyltransferase [Flavobacteriales bacterium]|nr:UDP-3-O-(3-hydroxymyristoyl)glucosamine N-acyltransferase [Flavobacteriales bacterium]